MKIQAFPSCIYFSPYLCTIQSLGVVCFLLLLFVLFCFTTASVSWLRVRFGCWCFLGCPDFAPFSFLQIYAYVFENIKSVQLEALLFSLLSIIVLVLVKELNEQFKRKIKVVLPVDLVLVSMQSAKLSCFQGRDIICRGLPYFLQ
jgi:hypothetical protein